MDKDIDNEINDLLIGKYNYKGYVLLLEGNKGGWKKGYWKLDKLDLLKASKFLLHLDLSERRDCKNNIEE